MKNLFIIISIFSFLAFSSFSTCKPNSGLIRIIYSSDQNKPYPRILLYLKNSENLAKADSFATHKLEINTTAFEVIKNSIKSSPICNDSVLLYDRVLQFEILDNNETIIVLTPNYSKIRKVFATIYRELEEVDKSGSIKEVMKDMLIRIAYENNLEK